MKEHREPNEKDKDKVEHRSSERAWRLCDVYNEKDSVKNDVLYTYII